MESLHWFGRGVRLEASYRALQKRDGYLRLGLVWVFSFSEIMAVAAVPGVHLTTSPIFTIAPLSLMFVLACWQAGSVSDIIWQPAYLLRPKGYSKFGIGVNQRSSRTFLAISMVTRLACSVTLATNFLVWVFDETSWMSCEPYYLPWAKYKRSELQSDLSVCAADPQASEWCETLDGFQRRCNDPVRWTPRMRSYAWQGLGLECTNSTGDLAVSNAPSYGTYCEIPNGKEIGCYAQADETLMVKEELIIWTDEKGISLAGACDSWPESLQFSYHCQMFFHNTDYCHKVSDTPAIKWDELLWQSCEAHRCVASLPQWLHFLTHFERKLYCHCQQCTPWWRVNQCSLEVVDWAIRRILEAEQLAGLSLCIGRSKGRYRQPCWAGLDWLQALSDPRFGIQLVFLGFCMFGPVAWLLNSLLFCACAGNPWAVPLDVDMNETIKKEELVIQEELSVNGSIQTSCFGRLGMLLELGFCLADFATDIQMIFLYHKAYHYGFAIVQGCMVLRILLEQVFRLGLLHIFRETYRSLSANLRTDHFLSLVQSERTGEATLSFLLQVYTFFYMGQDRVAYWTAFVSLMISARGLTQGCYVHFDLAYMASSDEFDREVTPVSGVLPDVGVQSPSAAKAPPASPKEVPESLALDLPGEIPEDGARMQQDDATS